MRHLSLRLAPKLMLALAGVSLLGVAIAGLTFRLSLHGSFNQLITDEASEHFRFDVINYYRAHGSLDGVRNLFGPNGPRNRPNMMGVVPDANPNPANAPTAGGELPPGAPIAFGLADRSGQVVVGGDGFQPGTQAPAAVLRQGRRIVDDGVFVGTILPPARKLPPNEAEAGFQARIDTTLALAAALGVALSAAAGVGLARGISGPLRRLTAAAREVAAGRLGQTVPAKGSDELAELAGAFNTMSYDLERYEQARRQMAADIAHELRTPLTTISGYVEAMRDGELAPTHDRLDSVYSQTQRLGRVIEDLRLLSMADVGALPLERARISIRELIVQSVQAHALRASERGVALRADVEAAPVVVVDPGRIQQVVEILVNNALRHTEQGEVVVSTATEPDAVVIQVKDTGSGIQPELLPRLFDRFYRGDDARDRDERGAGLGLAIARAIVSAHDGTIAVASQLAQGTVFTIRLPLAS